MKLLVLTLATLLLVVAVTTSVAAPVDNDGQVEMGDSGVSNEDAAAAVDDDDVKQDFVKDDEIDVTELLEALMDHRAANDGIGSRRYLEFDLPLSIRKSLGSARGNFESGRDFIHQSRDTAHDGGVSRVRRGTISLPPLTPIRIPTVPSLDLGRLRDYYRKNIGSVRGLRTRFNL